MANSSSYDSCNSVPELISACNSFNSTTDTRDKSYRTCPICLNLGKFFYCADCVRNGAFTHSLEKCLERFADKKLKEYKLNEKKEKLSKRYQSVVAARLKAENLKLEISLCSERNKFLKEGIKKTSDEIQKCQKVVEHVRLKNESWHKRKVKLIERISAMKKEIDNVRNNMIRKKKLELENVKEALRGIVRKRVKELVTHIFPITEVKNLKNSGSLGESQRTELEEAQHITFVKDHWVLTRDPECLSQYSIVKPCLPGNGDYSAYTLWTSKECSSASLTEQEKSKRNLAYNIGAALTFTTQFVMVLSFYLDIHLPKHLCYSEFCGHDLKEQWFLHNVAKLNTNVIHLCLSQGVQASLLRARRTIPNLLLLLDPAISDLGCPVDTKQRVPPAIEEIIAKDLMHVEDGEERNSDEMEQDWVKVSDADEDAMEYMAVYHHNIAAGDQAQVSHRATTLTGDLMSSVASMWRAAMGGQR